MTLQIRSLEEYHETYQRSVADPEGFWAEQAATFRWSKPWKDVLKWNFKEPKVKWFVGGKLNITENCLDRHVAATPKKTALIWEPNNPNDKPLKLTYKQLYQRVCQFANALKDNGVKKATAFVFICP